MNRLGRRPPSVVLIMRGFQSSCRKRNFEAVQIVRLCQGPRPSRQSESRVNSRVPRGGNVGLGNDSDEKTLAWRSTLAAPPLRVTSM
jgi:hypothetical protein